jgi:hypothetical protein
MASIFGKAVSNEQALNDWRRIAYGLLLVVIVQAIAMVWQHFDYPVLIADYDTMSGTGPAGKIKAADPRESAAFMQDLAELDISQLTSWTPLNIESRYHRFKNRLSSSMYGALVIKLNEEARDYASKGFSQHFEVDGTPQVLGNKVRIKGTITRNAGSKEVYRGTAVYELTYKLRRKGWPEISNIRLNPSESMVPDASAKPQQGEKK